MYVYLEEGRYQLVVICYASATVGSDVIKGDKKIRAGFSNAPLNTI